MSSTTVHRVVLSDDFYPWRYPLPSKYKPDLLASESERWEVLASIGITQESDETPLQAWRNAVADETGISRDKLIGNLDLGFSPAHVRQFAFYLA